MYYKYPRTPHFPFSLGATDDDEVLKSTDHFKRKQVVVTEKMDGENSTIYSNYYHTCSIESKHKEYHSWLLSYMKEFQYEIPKNWRICGEYLYAKHSIGYDNLDNYFEVFSIWNEKNVCLSRKDTEEYCELLHLTHVPVLYKGIYDEDKIKKLALHVQERGGEGLVVRLADGFCYEDFGMSIAKYVRPNHVQTGEHWAEQTITVNHIGNCETSSQS